MGNHKFRFSDMIPNAWFYKLRDMSRSRKTQHQTAEPNIVPHTSFSHPRKSLYFSRELHVASPSHFLESPKRSRRHNRAATVDCGTHFSASVSWPNHDTYFHTATADTSPVDLSFSSDNLGSFPSSCSCTANESYTNDIVLDVSGDVPELELRPIVTKPVRHAAYRHKPLSSDRQKNTEIAHATAGASAIVRTTKEQRRRTEAIRNVGSSNATAKRRKSSVMTSSGMKLRVNSPRIGGRRSFKARKTVRSPVSGSSSSSLHDSFVVVKSSLDPYRDFRTSMMEMIFENNIRANKDLEELLACYLSLNSDEYHDLIVRVFKQIWFDFICFRSKQ